MRSKGCAEWLDVGLEFANAVTVENDNHRSWFRLVDCKGPNSVFAALSLSMPSIARISDGQNQLKGAISAIEFCKFLVKSGYEPYRHRNRVKGTKDKWTKGVQRWKNRRWVDLNNADELLLFQAKLEALKPQISCLCTLSERRLFEFLSTRPSNANCLQSSLEPDPSQIHLCCTGRTVPRAFFVPECRSSSLEAIRSSSSVADGANAAAPKRSTVDLKQCDSSCCAWCADL